MKEFVWANALLSDGKILFWWTGDECRSIYDFYKDFYYAGLPGDYEEHHKMELVKKSFRQETHEDNDRILLCDSCRAKRRIYMAMYNNHPPRGEYGICWTCNKREAIPGKRLCPECAKKAKRNLVPGPKGFTGDINAVLFAKKRKEETWNG